MKIITPNPPIAIAACLIELNSRVPSEIQLLPSGRFSARDGRPSGLTGWYVDAAIAQQLIAQANAQADDYVIDYEHQVLNAKTNGQPAPASGWFKQLEWREGVGLFAVNVSWTAAAKAHINNNEYRYISPVFSYDKATGAVTNLLMAALVNTPALDGMKDLAAAYSQLIQEQPMDLTELIKLLGLADGAELSAIIEAVKELKATADKASGEVEALKLATPDPAKFVPLAVMSALQGELSELKADLHADKVTQLITAALSDGRLLLAQKDWASILGRSDIAALSSYLNTVTPIAALSAMQSQGNAPDKHTVIEDVTTKAIAYQKQQAALGIDIDNIAAVSHVSQHKG